MKIQQPEKIAICLLGGNAERNREQMETLMGLSKFYIIEWWDRSKKQSAGYNSFSQMVNEATCETTSEFMVYINPKTNPTIEYVNEIIHDLCNGMCWSAKVAFGLFGTTKQLYRRIGMMDERFVGGEFEDDDFSLRLKRFGKAIRWEFDVSVYPWDPSPLPSMRGSTSSLFMDKWMEFEPHTYSLNPLYKEEKMMPYSLQIRENSLIEDSWLDWDQMQTDNISHVVKRINNASFKDLPIETTLEEYDFALELTEEQLYVEYGGGRSTTISIQLTSAEIGKEYPLHDRVELKSGNWIRHYYDKADAVQVRIYHRGEKIYHNFNVKPGFKLHMRLGLKVNSIIM